MFRRSSSTRRALAATVGAFTLLAACSGSSSSKPTTTTTRAATGAKVKATVGTVTMATSGLPGTLADADRVAVLAAMDRYIDAATITPLSGKPAKNLASQFTASAAPALTGPEQDALVDTGVPHATGAVTAKLAPVNVTALSDQAGAIDLVGTTFDLTVNAKAKTGPITIHRTGEFMFTRDGGTWKILGFTLAVTRDGAGLGTAPTSTTGSAP